MQSSQSNAPVITELDAARIRELGARLPDQGRSLRALGELIDMVTAEATSFRSPASSRTSSR